MIGLLGGLGVGAAVHDYRELATAHRSAGREMDLVMVHEPVMFDAASTPFPHVDCARTHIDVILRYEARATTPAPA
jgi:hypothetical protein